MHAGVVWACVANVLEDDFSVSNPFIYEPILVLFDLIRNEEILACPA
jgi:hypothetical protein